MPDNKQPIHVRIKTTEGRELLETTVDSLALGSCWNIKDEGSWYTTDYYQVDPDEDWTVIVKPIPRQFQKPSCGVA